MTKEYIKHSLQLHRARIVVFMIGVTYLVAMTSSFDKAYPDSLNAGLYSSDSSPFGIPYKDWIAKWWDYNVGISAEEHPRDNFSPERCNLDKKQGDSVYYLPDNLGGEEKPNCSVPAGKRLLLR